MFDAVIVGAGPSGLSAGLLLSRARRKVLVCNAGRQRNAPAAETHGFLSRDGTPPLELLAEASKQLQRYPTVEIAEGSVTQIHKAADGFTFELEGRNLHARRVILATGMVEQLPPIPGLRERWGHSVFSCPYCDGWEVRDRPLAIGGESKGLVPLAQELYQWSRQLTLCGFEGSMCSPHELAWIRKTGTATEASRIAALDGTPKLTVRLENGELLSSDALFLCVPLVQRSHLVSDLGCTTTPHGRIVVDEDQQTSVPGVYAAGDATAHIHQVVTAAATGTIAAIAVNNALTAEDVSTTVSVA